MAETEAAQTIHVLGFAGSLRQGSYNRSLLRAAQELSPEGMAIEIFDLTPVPLYLIMNADIEEGDPEPAAAFKAALRRADARLSPAPNTTVAFRAC
jgi:chromate reductase, NAD(P)H dehydrogenase (quinone)